MLIFHSTHKTRDFVPQAPEIDKNDENGGCHPGKMTVCQKHRFDNPDKQGESSKLCYVSTIERRKLLCLQFEHFSLQLSFFAYSPFRCLLDTLSHCKQKASIQKSLRTPTPTGLEESTAVRLQFVRQHPPQLVSLDFPGF